MMHFKIVIICLCRSSAHISVDQEVYVLKQNFLMCCFYSKLKQLNANLGHNFHPSIWKQNQN